MTANNSPHQGTATSEVGGLCGCLPDFVPLGASLSVATFLKIYTDFSSKFENWCGRSLARVRSVYISSAVRGMID